jgi:hypothetical protein
VLKLVVLLVEKKIPEGEGNPDLMPGKYICEGKRTRLIMELICPLRRELNLMSETIFVNDVGYCL